MDASRSSPLPAVERHDREAAEGLAATLFRALCDGSPHRIDDLRSRRPSSQPTVEVPRDAVLAALDALEAAGVLLERDGDTVRSTPATALDAEAIGERLRSGRLRRPTEPSVPDWNVRVTWTVGSTNTALLARVRERSRHDRPLLAASEIQDAGRGRLGRRWRSAPGASLTFSVALRVGRPLAALEGVTLACGLAVRAVVAQRGVAATLKWPNDVLVDGRKLAGVLVEAHAVSGATVLVVGLGLNVLPRRPGADATDALSTDLASCGATALDRNALAADVALALGDHLATFAVAGFGAFAAAWNDADAFRDRPVQVGTSEEVATGVGLAGVARGVDDSGALRLDVGGRLQRVVAGDVSLRPVPDGIAGPRARAGAAA